jgi:hypothetical protein
MANGLTLVYDPDSTVYRKVRIATGTGIMQGTVMDRVRNSATVDAQGATASSVTSSIYGVTIQTTSTTDSSTVIALLTPRQLWQADPVNQPTSAALAATYAGYAGQRMILGVQTFTVGTTAGPAVRYLTSTGVQEVSAGTAFTNLSTVNNTGTDVTGTTGVFEQTGLIVTSYTAAGVPSTGRIVGRFLNEHAA